MMIPSLEHHTINTNGIALHTVQAGPEDGPIVMLLHGFPEFWYGWHKQIPALVGAGYRVVVPDQRGYNLSDKPAHLSAYKSEEMAADIVGLIDALGSDSLYLIGHDWGAIVAWNVALLYPDRLKKMGILNVPHPAVMMRYLKGSFNQIRKSWYMFFFQIPWLPEAYLGGNNYGNLGGILKGTQPDAFTELDIEKYREAWSQPGALKGMLSWYRAMMQRPSKPLPNQRIQVPTLVIWGKQDVALSHEMAQPSIDLCDDGQLVMIEQASHFVQHDAPKQVNKLLLEFIGN